MESILFVDDEINILNSLKRGLIDEEYACFFALSGKEALVIMKANPISVIVTDMRMPEMDGLTLLKEVKEKYPKTVRIVLSGYTQLQQVLATINQVDIFKFITKPWKLEEEFKVVIRQAVDYHRLQVESEELRKSLESKNQAYQNILKSIDEVIANAKNDVQVAKGLSIHTVEYVTSLMDKDESLEDIKAEIKSVKRIFNGIIDIMAADWKDISFKELLEHYVSDLKSKEQITRIDLTDTAQIKKMHIKSELIMFLLTTMEEFFIKEEGKYYLKLLCEEKAVNGEWNQAELTVLISCLSDNNTVVLKDENAKVIDEKIVIINKYMNDALKSHKGSISAARVDINIGIKIQLQYKKPVHGS